MNDIEKLILEYRGTSITPAILSDVRHSGILARIESLGHNFRLYAMIPDVGFCYIKQVRFCSCAGVMFCGDFLCRPIYNITIYKFPYTSTARLNSM